MIQQKLTKTKNKMILITKTLVIFPLFTLSTSGSQAGSQPCNIRSTGDQTDPKPH